MYPPDDLDREQHKIWEIRMCLNTETKVNVNSTQSILEIFFFPPKQI